MPDVIGFHPSGLSGDRPSQCLACCVARIWRGCVIPLSPTKCRVQSMVFICTITERRRRAASDKIRIRVHETGYLELMSSDVRVLRVISSSTEQSTEVQSTYSVRPFPDFSLVWYTLQCPLMLAPTSGKTRKSNMVEMSQETASYARQIVGHAAYPVHPSFGPWGISRRHFLIC